jgi:hypothetical protein
VGPNQLVILTKPVRPHPTTGIGGPDAHLMLRNDRSINPDPHQPRRATTTLNKHEGSPFASTKSTPITGQ